LAARLIDQPLEKVIAFLRVPTVDFIQQVLGAVDDKAWNERRKDSFGDLQLLPKAANIFDQLGRTDLLETLARKLIYSADSSDWHREGIHFYHLSHVLRLGKGASAKEKIRLLDSVITHEWMYQRISSDPAGVLSSSLFSIWTYLEPELHAKFRALALRHRVSSAVAGLERAGWGNLSVAAETLCLLGVSILFGISTRDIFVRNLSANQLNLIVESMLFGESEADRPITIRDIQFWVGIFVVAQLQEGEILQVYETMGQRAIDLFEDSRPPTHQAAQLRDYMIRWLRRCADARWQVLGDEGIASLYARFPYRTGHDI
jgi:hypothetical protein